MAVICNCDSGLANLGTPSCDDSRLGVANRLVLVPLVADDGTENVITIATDTLDATYFTDAVNNTDPSKRWYPTPKLENVEDTKADSIFETLNSGKNIFIQEGVRTFNGVFIKEGSVFLGKLKAGRCIAFGVYVIDDNGSLYGKLSKDGTKLKPIAIDEDTWDARLIKPTDTTSLKVQLSFEFKRTEKDEDLRVITSENIADVDLTDTVDFSGLLDVNASIGATVTTTDFTATLTYDYGDVKTPLKFKGAVIGDFVLLDSGGTPIVITSVTESADGVYDFVYPVQPSGDMTLQLRKNGFEMDDTTVTVP